MNKDGIVIFIGVILITAIFSFGVGFSANKVFSDNDYDKSLEKLDRKYRNLLIEQEEQMVHFLNILNPRSYDDIVSVYEDENYYYIEHSENITMRISNYSIKGDTDLSWNISIEYYPSSTDDSFNRWYVEKDNLGFTVTNGELVCCTHGDFYSAQVIANKMNEERKGKYV